MTTVACDQPRFAIKTPTNYHRASNGCAIIISRVFNAPGTMSTPPGRPVHPGDLWHNELSFILVPETLHSPRPFALVIRSQVARPLACTQISGSGACLNAEPGSTMQ
jgi:hypothetical protein